MSKEVGFARTKRPELFPVKGEHSNPCSYLAAEFTHLNKRGVSIHNIYLYISYFVSFIRQLKVVFYVIGNESQSTRAPVHSSTNPMRIPAGSAQPIRGR